MKKSFSPHWDRLVREALRTRDPSALLNGRAIEVTAMSMVLFPERIQLAWDEERYDDLAYFVEYFRTGMPKDLDKTDRVLHGNLRRGFQAIRRMGWDKDPRMQPGPLRIRAAAQKRRAARI